MTARPSQIGDYSIIEALPRGFYGVPYIATRGGLQRRRVLKVVPVRTYDVFGKDFDEECRAHAEVAAGTDHLVDIDDMFDEMVVFGDVELKCHVAVLDFVEGENLERFAQNADARSLAQIAIDLFSLLRELENKQRYHNDLHARNIVIQRLGRDQRRAEAVEPSLRAVAVDLGSLADRSKSDDGRPSDLHSIARHLFTFVDRLLERPEDATDQDYRLAAALQEIGQMLTPDAVAQRAPDFGNFITLVRNSFNYVASPWREPGSLQQLSEGYNAQTLHSWFVPRLLVDPEGNWLRRVSTVGPQLIAGMRGCGKTMLLRSLQFHARASGAEADDGDVPARLADERFLGLFVSCTRLLDRLGRRSQTLHEPYARLYLAYAREAVRAIRHLREIAPDAVMPEAHRTLGEAVGHYLTGAEGFPAVISDLELERRLQQALVALDRGSDEYTLASHPTIAFPHLADAIRGCSPLWNNSIVLFLLDDVSTRHLEKEAIGDLISTLLFSNDVCTFKVTTEVQTLEELLRSPGLIERARIGRDYEVFDLGGEVNKRLARRGGKKFISDILAERARQYAQHPNIAPMKLLGDVRLEQIAREIHSASRGDRGKKTVYRGLSALTAICVGDIGDVIAIYEMMLREGRPEAGGMIDAGVQSMCYQDYCSRRLYHLNRRDDRLKDFALSFAEASRDLLLRSEPQRIRQYAKIYVRLTTGDTAAQFAQIRDLIDAGVFVFEGGSDTPRTKTRDADPLQQFVLTYRKLYGLSSFIGISNRDRFELSGEDLEEWLEHPANGREILMRHLGGADPNADEIDEDWSVDGEAPPRRKRVGRGRAATPLDVDGSEATPRTLFDIDETRPPGPARVIEPLDVDAALAEGRLAAARVPRVSRLEVDSLAEVQVDVLVGSLGFEERTVVSLERLLAAVQPAKALLVRYPEPGYTDRILRLVGDAGSEVDVIEYEDVLANGFPSVEGAALIDVTGLAKPVLFGSVRNALAASPSLIIAHTLAEQHYPLSEDVERVLGAAAEPDPYQLLAALDSIWSGEEGPYQFVRLLHTEADESRRRLLVASASPKHQRLLSLVDERDFDRIELLAPSSATPRSHLARIAAEVAVGGAQSAAIHHVDSNDLSGALAAIARSYQRRYAEGGYDFEFGLTGSKLHAVAFAAACASLKIAECWYVRPGNFDVKRFTHGVRETHLFSLTIRRDGR